MDNSTSKKSNVKKPHTKNKNSKKVTEFKVWCVKNGITQISMREKTALSIGCIHATWNEGKATDSTIRLISLVYSQEYGISEDKFRKMITKFVVNPEFASAVPQKK